MTREEIKNIVRHVFHFYEVNAENCNWADMNEACGEIFKALEQEFSGNAISRQEVLKTQAKYAEYMGATKFWQMHDDIKELPSVNPHSKTSHWTRVTDNSGHLVWECYECGWQQRFQTDYCPDCGFKMIEP